jgi:fatty acid synthase subunit alpha, fungi type
LQHKAGTYSEYSNNLNGIYLDLLHETAASGTSFTHKNTLVTGVGKDSIGVEIIKVFLQCVAHVVITTSRHNRATVEYSQGIFQVRSGWGSALTVTPFKA